MALTIERKTAEINDKCAFDRGPPHHQHLHQHHRPATTSLHHLLQPLNTIEPSALTVIDRATYISPRSYHLSSSPYRASDRTLPSPLRPKPEPLIKSEEQPSCSAELTSSPTALIPHDSPFAMSGYYYDPNDDELNEQQQQQQHHSQQQQSGIPSRYSYQPQQQAQYGMTMSPQFPAYTSAVPMSTTQDFQPQRYMVNPQNLIQQHHQYSSNMATAPQHQSWSMPTSGQPTYGYPGFQQQQQPASGYSTHYPVMAQQHMGDPSAAAYLSPPAVVAGPSRPRPSRTASNASHASYASSVSYTTDNSRSGSPSVAEMTRWGVQNADGTYSCSYRGCTSKSRFTRGCDLRKHYKRHTKSLFCRYDGCPQSKTGGFSSNKDRTRHEQKHNPNVRCEWAGCDRMFSRVDNMKDHVRRVHLKYSSAG